MLLLQQVKATMCGPWLLRQRLSRQLQGHQTPLQSPIYSGPRQKGVP